MIKVICINNYSVFKAVGVNVVKINENNTAYGIVSDNYRKDGIFTGSKQKCIDFITNMKG